MATKTLVEKVLLYEKHDKPVQMDYYPNSHAYKIEGDKKIGVTTITGIIAKEGLMFYYMAEALKYIQRNMNPQKDGVIIAPESPEELQMLCDLARKAHADKSQRGKDTGTLVHSWLEAFLIAKRDGQPTPALPERVAEPSPDDDAYKSTPWTYDDDLQVATETNNLVTALEAFVAWWDENDIEIVDIERIVYSRRYDFAGRLDCVLRINGKLYLVDFKTNNPSWEYPKGIFPEVFCQLGGYDVAYTEEHHPELDAKNDSVFDGHLVLNFGKQNGKFSKEYSFDTKINRSWFVHTLGTKRGMQHNVRNLSLKYKENRPERKAKKGKK